MATILTSGLTTKAYDDKTHIYFFHAEGCIICATEAEYLDELEASDPDLVIHRYEIAFSPENQAMLKEIEEILNISIKSTPTLVIGRKVIVGFNGVNAQRMALESV